MTLYHGSSTMFENFDLNMAGSRTESAYCPDEFVALCNLGVFFLDNKDGDMEMYDDGYVAEVDVDINEDSAYVCHMNDLTNWLELATAEEIIEEISEEHSLIKMDNGNEWEYILFDLAAIKSIKWDCTK